MSIVVNSNSKGNFIANNKQLQKIYANGVLVWENWKPWSNSASGSWDSYPSSPKYATVNVPANTRVTHISAVSSKAYVEGEYGRTIIEGYYNGSWHELARSEPSFSESSCSWSGDIYMSSVRSRFEFQVCRDVMTKVSVSGLTKGN